MRYLISMFDCVLDENELTKNCCYTVENISNKNLVVYNQNNNLPILISFKNCFNLSKICYKQNEYYFLFDKNSNNNGIFMFKYQNKQLTVCVFDSLSISLDGEIILNKEVSGVTYSHFEIKNQFCFIYFCGKRNFVVVLNGGKVEFCSFYDEVNISENEFYFMCKLYDCLNHGKVFHIKDKIVDNYLVYLDDLDLNLRTEFVGCVFLDCLLAGNLKYANNLLSAELKQKQENNILKFLPEFDFYYPISKTEFILVKKNTLAGILIFELNNLEISNITLLD